MMAFCIVRLVSGTRARIATCITPRPYRGRGFGKALLCNVVKHLRKENGIKEVLLFMDEGDPGVNLYANIGFVSEATMHIYEVVLANSATVGRRFSLMDGTSLAHGRTSFSTPVRPGTSDTTASRGSFDTQQLLSRGMRAWMDGLEEVDDSNAEDVPFAESAPPATDGRSDSIKFEDSAADNQQAEHDDTEGDEDSGEREDTEQMEMHAESDEPEEHQEEQDGEVLDAAATNQPEAEDHHNDNKDDDSDGEREDSSDETLEVGDEEAEALPSTPPPADTAETGSVQDDADTESPYVQLSEVLAS